MQKKVLAIFLILAVLGIGAYMVLKYSPAKNVAETPLTDNIVPNVSTDIIWNAYTLGATGSNSGTTFIYPSDWIFEEVADTKNPKSIVGFKVSYPISSNSADAVEVHGACPGDMPPPQSYCANGIFVYTPSENPVVIKVFRDMEKFNMAEQQ